MTYLHVKSIQEMARLSGVTAYGPNRHGHLVVSESDLKVLREAPFAEPRHTAVPVPVWMGITIETAPDWTCNPLAVASARLAAIVLRPFARLLRWMTRRMTRL